MFGDGDGDGDGDGNGGDDDGGEAAADEFDASGFEEVIDEGLAEGEEEYPFEVAFADVLPFAEKNHGGDHDDGGNGKAKGDECDNG